MEKNNVILADDELKDVSGGTFGKSSYDCGSSITRDECIKRKDRCIWDNMRCVVKNNVW